MASSSDPQDILNVIPEFVPKSNVWTRKHKYPRTIYNTDYMDWTHHPLYPNENLLARYPVQSCSPKTTLRIFRPLPPYEKGAVVDHQLDLRKKLAASRGLSTPEPTLHLGHKHFSLNPICKRLRKYDDPIPQPLDTTKRISYVDPRSKEDFDSNQNVVRYGLSDHNVALGIVPCTLAIPPEPVKDTSNC